jgi:hypothetical protein
MRLLRPWRWCALVILVAGTLVGVLLVSSRSPSLVGYWVLQDTEHSWIKEDRKFNANGTWEERFTGSGVKETSSGTFKISGDVLSLTTLETAHGSAVSKKAFTSTLKVRWGDANTVELSESDYPARYVRG